MNQALERIIISLSWSIAFAIPIIVIILLLYAWDYYKKKTNKVVQKAERIIVKMNQPEEEEKQNDIDLANETEDIEYNVEDSDIITKKEIPDYSNMTLKELHKLPEVKEIRGFSRMPKDKLLKMLE